MKHEGAQHADEIINEKLELLWGARVVSETKAE